MLMQVIGMFFLVKCLLWFLIVYYFFECNLNCELLNLFIFVSILLPIFVDFKRISHTKDEFLFVIIVVFFLIKLVTIVGI